MSAPMAALWVYACFPGAGCDMVTIALFDTMEACETVKLATATEWLGAHPGYSWDGRAGCIAASEGRKT